MKHRRGSSDVMSALLVVFVALKLTGVIDWSWWIVLLPAWFGLAIILVAVALLGIGGLTFAGFTSAAELYNRIYGSGERRAASYTDTD